MDDMEAKLNAVLGNPDMMAQIMSMAQSLGGGAPSPPPPAPTPPAQPAMAGIPDGLDVFRTDIASVYELGDRRHGHTGHMGYILNGCHGSSNAIKANRFAMLPHSIP